MEDAIPKQSNIEDRSFTELDKEKLVDDEQWKDFWNKKAEWEAAKKYVTSTKTTTSKTSNGHVMSS